jgi:CRP-like cAMP-binding protein
LNNLLFSALSDESRAFLKSRSTNVDLVLKEQLYRANETPTYAYFLTSGLASVVTMMASGETAEVGFVGCEGVVSAIHLLGSGPVATTCFMQLAGTAARILFHDLQGAFQDSEEIRQRILESAQEQAVNAGQIAGCNRLHTAEERLARWLLMARDRVRSGDLKFSQEFLAEMLGVHRPTVSIAAGALQRAGHIEYGRGEIRIIDGNGLQSAACICYQITKRAFDSLYAIPYGSSHSGSVTHKG